MKKLFYIACAFLLSQQSYAWKDSSLLFIDKIKNEISYDRQYAFINYDENILQWDDKKALKLFFNQLEKSDKSQVRVLHIGDSHLQADLYTGHVRDRMQLFFGQGGRGFVFPYAAARTHAAYDYKTTAWGQWGYFKNIMNAEALPIGISGACVFTQDSNAGFALQFRPEYSPICGSCRKVTFLVHTSDSAYDVGYKIDCGETIWVDKDDIKKDQGFSVVMPCTYSQISLQLRKSNEEQNFFECYGMLIENTVETGVLYSSVGINGAGLKSVLRQMYFTEQLKSYDPHLVVIDLGANDYYSWGINEAEFKSDLKEVIRRIRNVNPHVSIILSCSQDIQKRRRYSIAATARHAQLIKEVGMEEKCAWYDYYQIAGGYKSMLKWKYNHLAKKDGVHLTNQGYKVKGELFYNALLNGYLSYNNAGPVNVINKITPAEAAAQEEESREIPPAKNEETRHMVKKGETLFFIASKYDLTVEELKKMNGLNSDYIRPSMVLVVTKKGNASASDTKTTTKPTPVKRTTYTVRSGDTLSQIADRHNVSLAQLKRLNHLSSNKIFPGQKLIIR